MRTCSVLLFLLALAGCAAAPGVPGSADPCRLQGEASYACQIERYHNVAA